MGGVPDTIRNTERAELGEVPIVETQHKMCFLIAYVLECVTVAPGEIPNIAGPKNVRCGLAIRRHDCCKHRSSDDQSPLGRDRVPMQFTDGAGVQPHPNACNAL